MSFTAFHARITSPDLVQVATEWDQARGGRAVPSFRDIRPAAIARQLPIVWAYSYEAASDEFIGRLAGDVINQIFGRNLKGLRLSELPPGLDVAFLSSRFRDVMRKPALFRGSGTVFRQEDRHGDGERIIMPLSEDGRSIDGIFGATQYQTGISAMIAPTLSEAEEWFPLSWNGTG
jgi:hypothetical protein